MIVLPTFRTRAVIFDIDGTLADLTHRLPLIKQGLHAESEKYVHNDTPILAQCVVLSALRYQGTEVYYLTGRSESCRAATTSWLAKHLGGHPTDHSARLIMRPAGSKMKDMDFKRAVYNALSEESRKRLLMVFEDRKRVVEMWRSLGVPCCQVAEGDY